MDIRILCKVYFWGTMDENQTFPFLISNSHITLVLVPRKTALCKLPVIGMNEDKLWRTTELIYVDDACCTIMVVNVSYATILSLLACLFQLESFL